MGIFYHGGKYFGKIVWKLFADFKVEGLEYVPPRGPFLVVANHLSYFEPPMFAVIMPRRMNFMGKKDLFRNPLIGHALKSVYVFPVDRSTADPSSIRHALALLEQGKPLVVFPEGGRATTPGMMRGLPGVTYLALKAQVPILPVGIAGTEGLPGWQIATPFRKIRVKIGPTFTLPNIEGRISRDVLEGLTTVLMRRIAEQLPTEYQGVYKLGAEPPTAQAKGTPPTV